MHIRLDGKQKRILFIDRSRHRPAFNLPKEHFPRSLPVPRIAPEINASRLIASGPCHEILNDRLSNKVTTASGWINMSTPSGYQRLRESCSRLKEEKDLFSAQELRKALAESRELPSSKDLRPIISDCEKLLGYYFIYLGINKINDFFDFVTWVRKEYPDVRGKHRMSIAFEKAKIGDISIYHASPNNYSAIRTMLSSVFYFISHTQSKTELEIRVSSEKTEERGDGLHFKYKSGKAIIPFMTGGNGIATNALCHAAYLLEEELGGTTNVSAEKDGRTTISLWIPGQF